MAAGVAIRAGERVTRVHTGAGDCGVELRDGHVKPFGTLILAVSPRIAAAVAESSAELRAIAANARPVRIMSLDLALSRLPRAGAAFALGMDAPIYLSVHSAAAQLASHGGAVVHLVCYLAPDESPSPAGVFLAGDWAGLDDMLADAAAASAKTAALAATD